MIINLAYFTNLYFTFTINTCDFDLHRTIYLEMICEISYYTRSEIFDMTESDFAFTQTDKDTISFDSGDCAIDDISDFGFSKYFIDELFGMIGRLLINCSDNTQAFIIEIYFDT